MSQKVQEEILKGKQQTFGQFIWDSETSSFLGRTGASWAKIGFFYLIFYAFLAGFFSCMMAVFYTTLDTVGLPKYQPGNKDSLLRNPALGFRPLPRPKNVESTLIWYKAGIDADIKHWHESLDEFIKQTYDGTGKEGEQSNVKDCSNMAEEEVLGEDEVCKFDFQLLGEKCTSAEKWGYKYQSPCVILKMNKMIGWEPDCYDDVTKLPKGEDGMPEDLIKHIEDMTKDNGGKVPKFVWVSCQGENPADQEYIGPIEYTPWRGFPAYYFPYKHQRGYLPPIVAVRFEQPHSNVLINIQCASWAKNIKHATKERLGLVHFELLID